MNQRQRAIQDRNPLLQCLLAQGVGVIDRGSCRSGSDLGRRFAPFDWVSTRSRAHCQARHTQSLLCCRILAGRKDVFDGTTTSTGML